jgi:hypothetical protein
MKQPLAHDAKARERRFSGSEAVTQDCILSVFAEIVASREYFSDATGARRLRRFNVQNLQAAFPFHRLWNLVRRSGVNAALLWLRVRRVRCIAELYSAARPTSAGPVGKWQCARTFGRSADYKSAIRQIANLRYAATPCARRIPGFSLLQGCMEGAMSSNYAQLS